MTMLTAVLNNPAIYQSFQEIGGFFGARVRAITEYLTIKPGARVIDIGCGPGHIVRYLPRDIEYVGLDVDPAAIAYARARFGELGRFETRRFDLAAADALVGADIVMMNGVMHHLPDTELTSMLALVRQVLRDTGVFFSLDGCRASGQSYIARWLIDNDRGKYVRDLDGYRRLLDTSFRRVEVHRRDDLSRVPYTFAIGVARNDG